MTKQEEIREGIAKWLHYASTNPFKEPDWKELPEWRKDQYRKNAYFLMVKLNGEGVVIKVDRERPKLNSLIGDATLSEKSAYLLGVRDAEEQLAGFVAVEPLTEG